MNILITERINAANQYIELLAGAYRDEGHNVLFDVQNFLYSDFLPDMVHIHWPEAIYKWRHQLPANERTVELIGGRLRHYKKNDVPIVYTSHNLLPHKGYTEFDEHIYRKIVESADIIVHHGNASISLLTDHFPASKKAKHVVCPHGPYVPVDLDSLQARKKYGLPADPVVILNFGRQRENKGPEFIIDVFKKLDNKHTFLFTIGPNPPKSRMEKWMRVVNRTLQRAFTETFRRLDEYRFVDHTEIPGIAAASDIFFLGHQSGLNSGLLVLAISYGKPVVYPDLGNFRDQAKGWEWAESYEAGNQASAAAALQRMMKRIEAGEGEKTRYNNEKWMKENSWQKSVRLILDSVHELKAGKPKK